MTHNIIIIVNCKRLVSVITILTFCWSCLLLFTNNNSINNNMISANSIIVLRRQQQQQQRHQYPKRLWKQYASSTTVRKSVVIQSHQQRNDPNSIAQRRSNNNKHIDYNRFLSTFRNTAATITYRRNRLPLAAVLFPSLLRRTIQDDCKHKIIKEQDQQQFMSLWERTKTFSNCVYKIYQDYQLYNTINHSAQTALAQYYDNYNNTTSSSVSRTAHRWTQRLYRLRSNIYNTNSLWSEKSSVTAPPAPNTTIPSCIISEFLLQYYSGNINNTATTTRNIKEILVPYPQQQQQYQFRLAIQKVTPTIVGFMIPIVGYIPMLLSILLPQQLLCRHFYNTYEILYYNKLYYQQQCIYYPNVMKHILMSIQQQQQQQQQQQHLSDPVQLLHNISNHQWKNDTSTTSNDNSNTIVSTIQQIAPPLTTLSRQQLIDLSFCCNGGGIYVVLPKSWNYYCTTYCTPSWYICRFIRANICRIVHDDFILICEEVLVSHTSNSHSYDLPSVSFLQTMTPIELSDACLLRGLPIGDHISNHDMITSLTNHLQIVASIVVSFLMHQQQQQQNTNTTMLVSSSSQLQILSQQDIESIGLYMLYLPIIRDYVTKRESKQQ